MLTVTDDDGATTSKTSAVSVSSSATGGNIATSIWSSTLRRGRLKVTVNWTGATGNTVDIYRNGTLLVADTDDGQYIDQEDNVTETNFEYQVCDETGTCSDVLLVSF